MLNVRDFGAVGDGVTDDTAALQHALDQGGRILLPRGIYRISSTLTIQQDNVELIGEGWGSILSAAPAFPAGPMVRVQAPPSGFRYGIRVAHLFLNGNKVAGVGGLDLVSTYGAVVDHVRLRYLPGINLHFNGVSGAFGAYNYLRDSHITDGGAGAVGLQTDYSEWLTVSGCHFGYFQGGGAVAVKLQNLNNRLIGTSFDYNDTHVQLAYCYRNIIMGCQFDRSFTTSIYLQAASDNIISGNFFGDFRGTPPRPVITVDGGNNNGNVFSHNVVQPQGGWSTFVTEAPGTGGVNSYQGNDTGGLPISRQTGRMSQNRGINPVGALPAPALPAAGVPFSNPFGVDCTVYVTSSQQPIQVGGVSTGMTSGAIRVPAGATITVSGAAGWAWFGD